MRNRVIRLKAEDDGRTVTVQAQVNQATYFSPYTQTKFNTELANALHQALRTAAGFSCAQIRFEKKG